MLKIIYGVADDSSIAEKSGWARCKKVGKSQERREILEEEEKKITIKWRAAAEGGKFDWRLISRSAAQGPLFHRRRPTPAARLVGGETRKKQVEEEEEEDRNTPPPPPAT